MIAATVIEGIVALISAIPDIVSGADEASKAKVQKALDDARAGLASIQPNAPAVKAAGERRRAVLEKLGE